MVRELVLLCYGGYASFKIEEKKRKKRRNETGFSWQFDVFLVEDRNNSCEIMDSIWMNTSQPFQTICVVLVFFSFVSVCSWKCSCAKSNPKDRETHNKEKKRHMTNMVEFWTQKFFYSQWILEWKRTDFSWTVKCLKNLELPSNAIDFVQLWIKHRTNFEWNCGCNNDRTENKNKKRRKILSNIKTTKPSKPVNQPKKIVCGKCVPKDAYLPLKMWSAEIDTEKTQNDFISKRKKLFGKKKKNQKKKH